MAAELTLRSPARVVALVALLMLGGRASFAQGGSPAQDPRPTIAVMDFSGGAMINSSDYEALGRGLREILATALAANPSIRVVERAHLQAVLDEQQVSASSAVDPETAVRLGRVLGANHFITGGFLVDAKDHARIDIRSVNVETSEIEYRKTVEGNVSKLFGLLDQMTRELNAGLRLPVARAATAGIVVGSRGDQARATALLGRAIDALRRADTAAARTNAREALAAVAEFPSARALLDALEHRP